MTTKQNAVEYTVKATITRNYGAVSASFGADLTVKLDANMTTNQAYALLMDIINDQFAHYESANLHLTKADPAVYDNKGAGAKPELADCEKMTVELYKEKPSYKVFGGRFMKFGVPIYPEVLSLYRDLDKLEVGTTYSMKGWKMAVDLTKSAKVVQLIAPA